MFRRPACEGCIRRGRQRLHPAPADWCVVIYIIYNIYYNIYHIYMCRLLGVRQGWCPGGWAGAAAEAGGEDQRRRRNKVRNIVCKEKNICLYMKIFTARCSTAGWRPSPPRRGSSSARARWSPRTWWSPRAPASICEQSCH